MGRTLRFEDVSARAADPDGTSVLCGWRLWPAATTLGGLALPIASDYTITPSRSGEIPPTGRFPANGAGVRGQDARPGLTGRSEDPPLDPWRNQVEPGLDPPENEYEIIDIRNARRLINEQQLIALEIERRQRHPLPRTSEPSRIPERLEPLEELRDWSIVKTLLYLDENGGPTAAKRTPPPRRSSPPHDLRRRP